MGDHDMSPTCLSAEDHTDAVRDHLLHYLGCEEFCDREAYLESDKVDNNQRTLIKKELRRIQYLRKTLKADDTECHFITNLENSMKEWRKTPEYEEGRRQVQDWRKSHKMLNEVDQNYIGRQVMPNEQEKYNPDVDMNAYFIMYRNSEGVEPLDDDRFNGHFPNHKMSVSQLLENHGDSNPLAKSSGPATSDGNEPDGAIKYFHLPANNMLWIEKAIARYFNEPDLKYDGIFRDPAEAQRTKAYMLLRPQFWKGQQHGGRSAVVHARHLRPMCETVSSDPKSVEASPNNIVLFMPYMHWDTDRQREKVSQLIDKETENHRDLRQEKEETKKRERRKKREALRIPEFDGKRGKEIPWPKPKDTEKKDLDDGIKAIENTPSGFFTRIMSGYNKFHDLLQHQLFKKQKDGRILAGHPVGQVLFDAAMLYEAISSYRDKMLIKRYLHHDPPLHPRRTLDQAYYWTLKTTKTRDRDQVVYRGTRPKPEHLHGMATEEPWEWSCPEPFESKYPVNKAKEFVDKHKKPHKDNPAPPMVDLAMLDHKAKCIDERCIHCKDHIRKVSRVVMVDQLWMWILDEKTIITCFPKRYGLNKQDPSGVHKAIRNRLKKLRKDHIRTVFDLALIILDECSNTFFDRTKTQDRQPQVMDIFSEAIGDVTNKQTIGFEHLWGWTKKLPQLAKSQSSMDLSDFVVPLLNINPEGVLQREIKDIIDELDIMLHITHQQKAVIRKFKKDVEHLIDREGTWKDRSAAVPAAPINTDGDENSPKKDNNSDTESHMERERKYEKEEKRRVDFLWFENSVEELLCDVDDRIEELEGLKKSAGSTSESLDHLLALKQQQASVVQAWQAVKQAEETVKQGRAIMIFTVITIIFLPLAFMSSIFGMNNREISSSDAPMTLSKQLRLMFGISVAIILLVIVLAYSSLIRTGFSLAHRYALTWVVVKLGIYDVYLGVDWTREKIIRKAEKKVEAMKWKVKKAKQTRKAAALARQKDEADKRAEADAKRAKADEETERKKREAAEAAQGGSNGAVPVGPALAPGEQGPPASRNPSISRGTVVIPPVPLVHGRRADPRPRPSTATQTTDSLLPSMGRMSADNMV